MKLKDTLGKPNISEYVTYKEACYNPSYEAKGIDNTPNAEQLAKLTKTATAICDPVRKFADCPVNFKMFRSPAVEKAQGRSGTSQHCKCEATDITSLDKKKTTNAKIFQHIKSSVAFDQMINEYPVNGEPSWVHVSWKETGNRGQILTCTKGKDGKPLYTAYKKGDCNE